MMKKFAILAILMVYSLASFGVSLNYFYCCGKLKEVTVIVKPVHEKDCPVKKGKNCCENKTVSHKISVDQKNNPLSFYEPINFSVTALPQSEYIGQANIFTQCQVTPLYKKPPPFFSSDLNILLSTFRI